MMQRALLAVLTFSLAVPALAHGAPRGEAKLTLAGKPVVIDYGRPSLGGRDMLAKAEVGKPWRLGADAPTTLTTDVDLAFGATPVPKGYYVLTATRVSDDKWTLNLDRRDPKEPRVPGTKTPDVPLTLATLPEGVEVLTIELTAVDKGQARLDIKWGTTSLAATFSAK